MKHTLSVALILSLSACERVEPPTLDYDAPTASWAAQRVVACHDTDLARAAVSWWQDSLCPEAIRCAGIYEAWNVFISYEEPLWTMGSLASDPDASAYWEPSAERVWIWIANPATIDVEFRLTVHELGHAFGLAHDWHRSSAMAYPTPQAGLILLHHNDAQALDHLCAPK